MAPEQDLSDFSGVCRLFPLPGVVLLPHAVLPLHVFEPRYRQLTEDALAADRLVTIVQALPAADPQGGAEPPIEEVACVGRILNCERLADGRFRFLLLGCRRVRLVRELDDAPTLYRQAEGVLLDDEDEDDPLDPRREELIRLFRGLAEAGGGLDDELEALLATDVPLGPLTDIVAHALSLPPAAQQHFLADCRVGQRADGLIRLLRTALPASLLGDFPPPFSPN
jgi:Lon protease-like protein